MPEYKIEFTEDAKIDLSYYTAYERKIIVSEIGKQLTHQPLVETKNRKKLQDNPIASWELRIGKFRVFYEVIETTVNILIVGHKVHNVLFIRGAEVKI
jgi:mRNA-degrading endonuclease RelE of RelBE toxin-antitoxin system